MGDLLGVGFAKRQLRKLLFYPNIYGVPKWYTTLPPSYRTPQGRIAQVTQGFAQVFRDKQSDSLQTWLDQARRTALPEIGHFCEGLRRDEKAVNAAVALPWSNGQVEGQIHRLKLVKRQMYGRAKFNLLRLDGAPWKGIYFPSPQMALGPIFRT